LKSKTQLTIDVNGVDTVCQQSPHATCSQVTASVHPLRLRLICPTTWLPVAPATFKVLLLLQIR
jgi:hypothetical protein